MWTSHEGKFDDPDEFANEYVENIEQFTLLGNGKKLNNVDKRVEKLEQELKTKKEYRKSLSKQMNELRYFLGIDEDKFTDSIKKRHQKLKEEKKQTK